MTSLHLIRLMLASSLLKHSYLPPLPDVHSNVVEEEQANSNPTPGSDQTADDSHVTVTAETVLESDDTEIRFTIPTSTVRQYISHTPEMVRPFGMC